jgi:signal transduction histidine kinase
MERVRRGVAARRAHTDASLSAERATMDAAGDGTALAAQRVLDDLIERDRILADAGLLKFRESADRMLARERSASPAQDDSLAIERHAADEDKKAERKVTDALLDGERQRADTAVVVEREEHEAERARMGAQRHDTDDKLSAERSAADVTAIAFGKMKNTLAHARHEQARRSDVLGMVTHDLRGPLSVITVNAQWIDESTKDDSIREAAQEVTRAAARMQRLLTDLLDVARIESGAFRIVKREHDIGALVTEVFQSYRPLFAERRILFTVEVPTSAVVASFDHDRIVQVLSNLLGNAMKFTPPGGTTTLHVAPGPRQVEFVLEDSGPGIHPDALPHLFERFWQIDSDTRRGLGLGLYICKNIVEAHGGRIWADSDFGKGATLRFTLPAGLEDGNLQSRGSM